VGVDPESQRGLFAKILETAAAQCALARTVNIPDPQSERAPTIDAFIDEEGENGATFLLACLAVNSKEEIAEVARQRLSVELDKDEVARLTNRMPQVSESEIITILQRRGWSAYLRRLVR
jgi:hypothetical protein